MNSIGQSKFKLKTKLSRDKFGYHRLYCFNNKTQYYIPTDINRRKIVITKMKKELNMFGRINI